MRIERGHIAACPAIDGFELRNGRAVVRQPGSARLSQAVRRSGYAGRVAGVAEPIAEAFLGHRLAALAGENDKIAGQHVTVFDYRDGRFKIRYEGRELPYSVFDRLSQIRQADIVNNKRLGLTLAMAREAQLESNERRSKSCPSRPFPSASRMQ